MLKLIKKGEKLTEKELDQVKGGCGSYNPCLNCGLVGNDMKFDEQYAIWFWTPIV